MEAHQQSGQRIQQPVTQVWDAQSAAREQHAIRQRIVEVPGDDEPIRLVVAASHQCNGFDRRQAGLGHLLQQFELATGEAIRKLLHDVRRVAELEQPHDVAVQPADFVQSRKGPVVEAGGERPRDDLGVLGWLGQLQLHRAAARIGCFGAAGGASGGGTSWRRKATRNSAASANGPPET